MKTIVMGAFVVSLVMMVIGVSQGLAGNHRAAIPAIAISLLALMLGVVLGRE